MTANPRPGQPLSAGDHQRPLGQAVAREERLATEPARREHLGERVDRLRPNRLGAVEGDLPGRQVELRPVGLADAPQAQLEREVRPAAHGPAVLADRAQPVDRALQHRERRHQVAREADEDRLQDPADQAHVVVRRQPDHAAAALGVAERPPDEVRVVQQVGVREHHAARRGGRARRVLQQRDVVGRSRREPRAGGQRVGGQRVAAEQCGEDVEREHDPGLGVAGDRFQPRQRSLEPRWVGRVRGHGDDAGVVAAEQRRDVLEARRVDEQRAVASHVGERGGDRPRPRIELRVRHAPLAFEHERGRVRLLTRASSEDVGEARAHEARDHRTVERRGVRRMADAPSRVESRHLRAIAGEQRVCVGPGW